MRACYRHEVVQGVEMISKIVGVLLCLPGAFFIIGSLTLAGLAVVDAIGKETTTLEDALERPVKVEKYVDKENNVVCYWADRYPQYLACVQIQETGRQVK